MEYNLNTSSYLECMITLLSRRRFKLEPVSYILKLWLVNLINVFKYCYFSLYSALNLCYKIMKLMLYYATFWSRRSNTRYSNTQNFDTLFNLRRRDYAIWVLVICGSLTNDVLTGEMQTILYSVTHTKL